MNIFSLSGKTAIVTGAAQGLATSMAEGLMEQGAKVCLVDINPKVIDVAADYAAKGYECEAIITDVGDRENLEKNFNLAVEKLGGKLDIIVNAAGVQRRHLSEDFPISDWDFVMEINLHSVFSLCQLAGRQYIKQGTGGKIINVASMLSFFGGYTVPAYAASKGGVAQLTKALCNEWASKGININAVAPGFMATEMNVALINDETRNRNIMARIPAGRWGTPEDVKGIVMFLSSQASNYVNGAVIPCDGGYLAN